MSLISNLVPVNLEEEKRKFLAMGGDYNPQFIYKKEYSEAVLAKYGIPSREYYKQAVDYLATHPVKPPEQAVNPLTFEQMQARLKSLCDSLGIAEVTLTKNPDQNSRFMVTKETLSVQWPIKVSALQFENVLNHEIQTHLLRRLNESRQSWCGDKTRRNYLWKKTEEGLAMYNSKDKQDPDLRQAALLYELVYLANTADFVSVYRQSRARGASEGRAFLNALRVKRGVTDASRPGGFTKDLVYWEGYHQVRDYLADECHDIRDLYWGKIGIQEVEQLRPRAVIEGLIYPTFVV